MKVSAKYGSLAGFAFASFLWTGTVAAQNAAPPPAGRPTTLTPGAPPRPVRPASNALAGPRPVVLPDRFQRVDVAEFERLRARPDAVVVDVRTAEEFAGGHLPKAAFVDVQTQEFLGTIAGLDRSKLYLVNCAAGGRSARACQNFAALGFTNVVNLEGGFTAWKKDHADLVSKDPAVALPKSATPNLRQSGTAATPPPARPAPTNMPILRSPVIVRQTTK